MKILNPSIEISEYTVNNKFVVNVIRDDILEAGTKQRALGIMIKKSTAGSFVYAGPSEGYAQIALAYVCKLLGRKCIVVLPESKKGTLNQLTKIAKSHGAEIIQVPKRNNKPPTLKVVQNYATNMVIKHNKTVSKNNEKMELLPFGLHSELFISELTKRLKQSIPAELLKNPPKRLWTVAGSATLLASYARIWPKTKFMVVQVGKKIWSDQLGATKAKGDGEWEFTGPKAFESELFIAPEKFYQTAKEQPPYPTVRTYDAKLWQFVISNGKEGDYIWNVGRDR